MKTRIMKLVISMAILAMGVMFGTDKGFLAGNPSVVYAAPGDKKKETKTTETKDGETLDESAVKDINDISVSMDSNGKMTTSFDDQSDSTKTWNTIFKKFRGFILGFSGIAALAFIFFFILNLISLGSSGNNPSERRKALMGLLWTGIGAAGTGSVSLICALFWNAFK